MEKAMSPLGAVDTSCHVSPFAPAASGMTTASNAIADGAGKSSGVCVRRKSARRAPFAWRRRTLEKYTAAMETTTTARSM